MRSTAACAATLRSSSNTGFESESESSVNALAEALAMSQPTTSKHLKVLRHAGLVSCRTAAQHRIYRIETRPFEALDHWLEPYRRLWTRHLDALERHLDNQEER